MKEKYNENQGKSGKNLEKLMINHEKTDKVDLKYGKKQFNIIENWVKIW